MMMMPSSDIIALTFQLGEQQYAITLDHVVEVNAMVELATIPDAPAEILGMANRHGHLIPIIDLRQVLGMSPLPIGLNTLFIVVQYGATLFGLVVDDVHRVEYLPSKQLQRTDGWGKYIEAMMSYQGGTMQFIGLSSLVARYDGTFLKAEGL
jgi:purine-binding chemotaxis protein CheW